jgi:hypothetical protein
VTGLVGTEDLTIHPRTGVAYLSSCDFRSVLAGRAAKCSLYAYDLNAPTARPVDLVPDAAPGFRPHGISLHVADDGTAILFAINHEAGRTPSSSTTWSRRGSGTARRWRIRASSARTTSSR